MTVQAFAAELKRALIVRGMSEDEAVRNVSNIIGSFTDESRHAVSGYGTDTVEKIADRVVWLIKSGGAGSRGEAGKKRTDSTPAPKAPTAERHLNVSSSAHEDAPDDDELIFMEKRARRAASASSYQSKNASVPAHQSNMRPPIKTAHPEAKPTDAVRVAAKRSDTVPMNAVRRPAEDRADKSAVLKRNDPAPTMRVPAQHKNGILQEEYRGMREKTILTPEGKKRYAARAALLSPVIAICSIVGFGGFGLLIAVLGIVCVAFFALFVSEVIVGSLLTLFSLIYGIVKLFSSVPVGIYEIGLSFIIFGASLALAVLTYKFSAGALPFLIKRLCSGMKSTLARLSEASDDFKRRCNEE